MLQERVKTGFTAELRLRSMISIRALAAVRPTVRAAALNNGRWRQVRRVVATMGAAAPAAASALRGALPRGTATMLRTTAHEAVIGACCNRGPPCAQSLTISASHDA
jgi:hypothetical protein